MNEKTLTGSYRQFYDSRYIAADDLPPGKDVKVKISNVTLETSKTDKSKLVSLHFEGKDKMMAVNKTNALSIRKQTGTSDVSKWIGHTIIIYQTTCRAFGDPNMPCIRVK